jgi:hypothetical protein
VNSLEQRHVSRIQKKRGEKKQKKEKRKKKKNAREIPALIDGTSRLSDSFLSFQDRVKSPKKGSPKASNLPKNCVHSMPIWVSVGGKYLELSDASQLFFLFGETN